MSVEVRHLSGVRVPVTLIRGVDHDAAARHLGRCLRDGSAFDSTEALVVDLSHVPDITVETIRTLDEASRSWERRRRWLAVSGVATYLPGEMLTGHRYVTSRGAVAAAQRFFRLVAGHAGAKDRLAAEAGAVLGVIEGVGEATLSVVSRVVTLPSRVTARITRGR